MNGLFEPLWLHPEHGVVAHITRAVMEGASGGLHPIHTAQTLVLLPYTHLLEPARRAWAQVHPDGFSPRFETTRSWAQQLGLPLPQGQDITGENAHDVLIAQSLLERAGMQAYAGSQRTTLVELAYSLLPSVAALPPHKRALWAEQARDAVTQGLESAPLAVEAACARIALEWVLASALWTDRLWMDFPAPDVRTLVVVQGLQSDPLLQALAQHWDERNNASLQTEGVKKLPSVNLHLPELYDRVLSVLGKQQQEDRQELSHVRWHACADEHEEAERAATAVLAHDQHHAQGAAQRWPVALVALDRSLTRRISALLVQRGVRVRDESGWKLSTTRAASHVMNLLRAAPHYAPTAQVLDWLKSSPAWSVQQVAELEWQLSRRSRRGVRLWPLDQQQVALSDWPAWLESVQSVRQTLRGMRTLSQWLTVCEQALRECGAWSRLEHDEAGEQVLHALRLGPAHRQHVTRTWQEEAWFQRKMDVKAFTVWVDQALESGVFYPQPMQEDNPAPDVREVFVLPLTQLFARPWSAVVLAGCDEHRFPVVPDLPGFWTTAQRQTLGLSTLEQVQAMRRCAWNYALSMPAVEVLWRQSDAAGEPVLISPLVNAAWVRSGSGLAGDERVQHLIQPQVQDRPQVQVLDVLPQTLSASAYTALRTCPYRFFALHLLGLREQDEMDAEMDKRDFGVWLHATLKRFHHRWRLHGGRETHALRAQWLDEAALESLHECAFSAEDFLPFESIWPRLRAGYLEWLQTHEQQGGAVLWEEKWLQREHAGVQLVGQVDRLDHVLGTVSGDTDSKVVIDYKTESAQRTQERIKNQFEEIQLPFYVALLDDAQSGVAPQHPVRAMYLNVGEDGTTKAYECAEVMQLKETLLAGIAHDMQRMAQGERLKALGQGIACEHCAARGLCRKDFWPSENP